MVSPVPWRNMRAATRRAAAPGRGCGAGAWSPLPLALVLLLRPGLWFGPLLALGSDISNAPATPPPVVATTESNPLLEVMYLKYLQQPIDTNPVFDPMVTEYKATLDWKMRFFSVQAKPIAPAVIDNIHLCPQEANCQTQDQRIVLMDFSRNVLVQPGARVLFKFDVLLRGVVRSYTIFVERLEGSETNIRHMIIQGSTVYPPFRSDQRSYRCFMDVTMEIAQLELHLQDGGQTILATADAPVFLAAHDNITRLRNSQPGNTRSPPMRLLLRRLREMEFGEFQYPNKYVRFPVPLRSKRLIRFKVISADAGHVGFYTMELGRGSCVEEAPLFDAVSGSCVRFCNAGFWADHDAGRCKICEEGCVNCMSPLQCIRCPDPDREREYVLDNNTGSCSVRMRPLWQQHPQHTLAVALSAACLTIFFCGLCALRCQQGLAASGSVRKKGAVEPERKGPAQGGKGAGGARMMKGNASTAGYFPVSTVDHDAF